MLRFNLPNETLTDLRFAYSPLLELTISYRVLRGNWQQAIYWRWLDEARQSISDVSYPYMDHLISSGQSSNGDKTGAHTYIPDFLTPTPSQPITNIEQEFQRILSLPLHLVRQCIQELISISEPNDLLCDFLVNPRAGLQALVSELRDYWQRTLAHHWHRMKAVLENDILYHSRILTLDGIERMFPMLNQYLAYDAGTIILDSSHEKDCDSQNDEISLKKPAHILNLHSDKFHLVPVIFAANGVYYQVSDQPMILYTPRGAGLWNYETPEPSQALEIVMGAGKSRILLALNTPFSTGELARKLSLTAGAVSQQLGKLHQAGLVESHRSGKHVFYRLSERGLHLVDLFC